MLAEVRLDHPPSGASDQSAMGRYSPQFKDPSARKRSRISGNVSTHDEAEAEALREEEIQ